MPTLHLEGLELNYFHGLFPICFPFEWKSYPDTAGQQAVVWVKTEIQHLPC